MSLFVYVLMAIMGTIALVWRIKLAEVMLIASAPVGAGFTFIALVTGSLWGKPMWGAWWVWDARLTFELILLFQYLGVVSFIRCYRIEGRLPSKTSTLLADRTRYAPSARWLPIISPVCACALAQLTAYSPQASYQIIGETNNARRTNNARKNK